MRDSKGALTSEPKAERRKPRSGASEPGLAMRCQSGFCLVATVQATRDSVFEGGFPDSHFDQPRGTLRRLIYPP